MQIASISATDCKSVASAGFLSNYPLRKVSYLNKIVPRYSELPKAIQENHVDLSCELINRTKRLPYLTTVTSKQIILNLASCLNNTTNYHINSDAFTQHTANFRSEVVHGLFRRVGVENTSNHLLNNSTFVICLQKIYPDADWSKVNESLHNVAFSHLNNLVDRRNEVAHGNPFEIELLSNDILLEYVSFLKAYGTALYEVVYSFTLQYLVKYKGIELGSPFKILQSGHVLGIEVKNTTIKVGDVIIAKPATDEQLYLWGEIQKLEVNKEDRQEVVSGKKVGIQVPFKAKENQIIFVVPQNVI